MVQVYDLKCEAMENPIGIDLQRPRLTWKLKSEKRGVKQTAYRLIVSDCAQSIHNGVGDFYDTGKITTDDNFCIMGRPLVVSGAKYYWAVKIWDEADSESEWSGISHWEMGLLHAEDWENVKWIEPDQKPQIKVSQDRVTFEIFPELPDEREHVPCLLMRKRFELADKRIRKARVYATAHGVYELKINNSRVGNLELAPEPTPYDKYLQYQTYDVTTLLQSGANAIGIHVAPGWWSGIIGLLSASCQYGDKMAALLKLIVEYDDGSREEIVSDGSFVSAESPLRFAEIFVGEKYDPSYEHTGWSTPEFDDTKWQKVNCPDYDKSVLRGQNAEHITITQRIKATRLIITPAGETIIDFGQAVAGKARIPLKGKAGTQVVFRYTEELDSDGNYIKLTFGTYKNDSGIYIMRGDGTDVYEPKFSYYGFRYVLVGGDVEIDLENAEALVMSSDTNTTSTFTCSDQRINRLQQNVYWTLRSNFVAIPTDNPDRERAGWTGDAQMIVETANYNLGLEAFWRRWLEEMRLEQRLDGQVTHVVPEWKAYKNMKHHKERTTSSGWGDACILVPWNVYRRYGDKRVLTENYDMMVRWLEYVRIVAETKNPPDIGDLTPERKERLKYIWNTGYHYGDWLTPSDCTDEEGNFRYLPPTRPLSNFVPSCFYAYSTKIMSEIAAALGKFDDSAYYKNLSDKIREACSIELFNPDGSAIENRQGAQIFALFFDVAPAGYEESILNRLLELIEQNDGCLDTGFSGTQYALDVLTEYDKTKEAYDLLFCDKYPSWLYEVDVGATTIWEAWQGIMPNKSVNAMSFIQYARGTVGNWLFSTVAGIKEDAPGFKRVIIDPKLDDRLDFVEASYQSVHGEIKSRWEKSGRSVVLSVAIPPNATATVILPMAKLPAVREGDQAVDDNNDILAVTQKEGQVELEIGSGNYSFRYEV